MVAINAAGRRGWRVAALAVLACLALALPAWRAAPARAADDASPPATPVRLVFAHHSVGQNWLDDDQGGLGRALSDANYYVSDTNYGWGPDAIGDRTDIPDWVEWFTGTDRYLSALLAEDGVNSPYTRTLADPGGANRIVVFKSCYPNSSLAGSPDDPPDPQLGLTVGHAKWVYGRLREAFAAHPDTLFVAVTAPPNNDAALAPNARAFNDWLADDWLADYPGSNIAVYDLFTVLSGPDNHHRVNDGVVERTYQPGMVTSYYASGADDDHPNVAGSRKATQEFVAVLNVFYHRWQPGTPVAVPPGSGASTGSGGSAEAGSGADGSAGAGGGAGPDAGSAPPQRVTGVHARSTGGAVRVGWAALPDPVDRYVVQVARGHRAWRRAGTTGGDAHAYTWRGGRTGVRYRIRVAARCSAGRGPFSTPVAVRVRA